MKRAILLLSVAILTVLPVTAQLAGDGSLANPYRGFLTADLTISGTKYFSGNIYVDNETLTFSAGARFIAVQGRATIFITDNGKLLSNGTALSPVRFTCDTDLDGITGEPEDYWGNITITSSNTSVIKYSIFERGRKDQVRFGLLGGGLCLGSSSVTVTNSTFSYCLASKGGAIAVISGSSPTISGCHFLNNSSLVQGGAVYAEAGSSPLISNCLFSHNGSTSLTLKGGAIASVSAAPIIVNSTIAYSTSPVSDGTSLYLENSPASKVINTVIWGGANHVGLNGTPASVLAYNAIEGASFSGNITLGSSNTAPDGPHFTDPLAEDYSIAFASPMRDMGADSYPGVTVPPKDIAGISKIYIKDIGAYESVYSRWNGSYGTSWLYPRNWDASIVPGSSNILIPAGLASYPDRSPGPSFTLNAGLEMILEPGTKVTFAALINNGTIYSRADATAMASLMADSYSGTGGNINVDVYLKGSPPDIDIWHYIAAPVTVSKKVFTDIEPDFLCAYDESKVITDVIEGWQWHDGYGGTTPFSNLEAKKGYDVLVTLDTVMTYRNLKALTTSLGRIDLPFSGSGGDTTIYGYSLLGNSLTCGINWDMVTVSSANVRNAYYLQTENGEASYVNGVGTNGATAHLPPLQGFFVRTRATGTYITIPDNAREHNATPRFKSAEQIPLLRLTLTSPSAHDEMVIRFDEAATTGFDMEYDAGKILNPRNTSAKIYSMTEGEFYSINSIPWPRENTIIPLTVIIPESGTFSIKRSQMPPSGKCTVVLIDRLTGKRVDLLAYPDYSFTSAEGTITDRFILTISPVLKSAVPEDKPEQEASSLKIYSASGKVCILPQGSEWNGVSGKVRIFDITGRMVTAENDERFNSGELKEYYVTGAGGLLIVEVTVGPARYLEKIVLTR